jgi:hypothetical protein
MRFALKIFSKKLYFIHIQWIKFRKIDTIINYKLQRKYHV